MPPPSPRLKAILQAVFVTFLWATSWILIKVGLHNNLPPITFAGLALVGIGTIVVQLKPRKNM